MGGAVMTLALLVGALGVALVARLVGLDSRLSRGPCGTWDPATYQITFEPPDISSHAPSFGSTTWYGRCLSCGRDMNTRFDGFVVPDTELPFLFRRLTRDGWAHWRTVTNGHDPELCK